MAVPATIQFDSTFEYGLGLPDGSIVWPPALYYGIDFSTPEGRLSVLKSIELGLNNLSLPEHTLNSYKWVKREVRTMTVQYHSADEALSIGMPEVLPTTVSDDED